MPLDENFKQALSYPIEEDGRFAGEPLSQEALMLLEDFTEEEIKEFEEQLSDLPRNTTEWAKKRYAAYLASQGFNRTEIGKMMNISPLTIKKWLQAPWVIRLIAKFQDRVQIDATAEAERIKAKFLRAADEASEKIIESMDVEFIDDPIATARHQYQAAKDILIVAGVINTSKKEAERGGGPVVLIDKLITSLEKSNGSAVLDAVVSEKEETETKEIPKPNQEDKPIEKERDMEDGAVATKS